MTDEDRRGAGNCVRCYIFDDDRDGEGLCAVCTEDEEAMDGFRRDYSR